MRAKVQGAGAFPVGRRSRAPVVQMSSSHNVGVLLPWAACGTVALVAAMCPWTWWQQVPYTRRRQVVVQAPWIERLMGEIASETV